MLRIRLFCANGMSTSLLVKKMEEAAKEIGYQLAKSKEICGAAGVPVDVIPMADYGMCNGMNVLRFAFKLAAGKE